MKKSLGCAVMLIFCGLSCLSGQAAAADKGPAELTLQSTIDPAKPPKPATFPHGAHQARLECKTCHHSKGADGKRIPYQDGQKIEKCETCHNSKTNMANKVNTFKNAAHALCQECHRKNRAELVKCTVCHKK